MSTISVNPPKSPVTTGSDGVAAATVPNVCKMPGPPAPFVPTPLPNIARSGNSPRGFSKTVQFDGCAVAVKGATFTSVGDVASKGTGGGVVSSNVEGPAQFVGPRSLDVKVEGKNVHLLSDPMLNNCGPGGKPPNAATMVGLIQKPGLVALVGNEPCPLCEKTHGSAVRLEETRATQGNANTFQAAAARARGVGKVRGTMLGVIHCVDGMVFAANSGVQIAELQAHMPGGWHAPVPNRLADFSKLVSADKQDSFENIWKQRVKASAKWFAQRGAPLAGRTRQQVEKEAGEPCFPPGYARPRRPSSSPCNTELGRSVSRSAGRAARAPMRRCSYTSARTRKAMYGSDGSVGARPCLPARPARSCSPCYCAPTSAPHSTSIDLPGVTPANAPHRTRPGALPCPSRARHRPGLAGRHRR